MSKGRIRVREVDRKRLQQLKTHPVVKRQIDGQITYEKILDLIYPEKVTEEHVLERPEEEMVWVVLKSAHETTMDLAGENMSAHHVLNHYIDQFVEEEGIDPEEIEPEDHE